MESYRDINYLYLLKLAASVEKQTEIVSMT